MGLFQSYNQNKKVRRQALSLTLGLILAAFQFVPLTALSSIPHIPQARVIPSNNNSDFASINENFLSLSDFKQLAEELSKKVNLFRDVWKYEPSAEFFGGTSRDFLYWLKGQLKNLRTQDQFRAKIAELKSLETIDVRDFIIGDSDVDIASHRGLGIQAKTYGVKKIDFISSSRFNKNSGEGRNEFQQGFIPVEKIRLSAAGINDSKDFGDGVREIYLGRPTVTYPDPVEFQQTHYAQLHLNHQILLALRYLRTIAVNYFQIHGRKFPSEGIAIDNDSYSKTKEIIDATPTSRDFLLCLGNEKFVDWLNQTMLKSFRSYTNPTVAFILHRHFGIGDLTRKFSKIKPVNQYVFAQPRDSNTLVTFNSRLNEAGFDEAKLFLPVATFFPNLTFYHGVKSSEEDFRSILLQGILPSGNGSAGLGLYGVNKDKLSYAEKWAIDKSRVVKFNIAPNARVLDITGGEGKRLYNYFLDSGIVAKYNDQSGKSSDRFTAFANYYGIDIIRYPYDIMAFVVKNGEVLNSPAGLTRQILTYGTLLEKALHINTYQELLGFVEALNLSNFSEKEVTSALKLMPLVHNEDFLNKIKTEIIKTKKKDLKRELLLAANYWLKLQSNPTPQQRNQHMAILNHMLEIGNIEDLLTAISPEDAIENLIDPETAELLVSSIEYSKKLESVELKAFVVAIARGLTSLSRSSEHHLALLKRLIKFIGTNAKPSTYGFKNHRNSNTFDFQNDHKGLLQELVEDFARYPLASAIDKSIYRSFVETAGHKVHSPVLQYLIIPLFYEGGIHQSEFDFFIQTLGGISEKRTVPVKAAHPGVTPEYYPTAFESLVTLLIKNKNTHSLPEEVRIHLIEQIALAKDWPALETYSQYLKHPSEFLKYLEATSSFKSVDQFKHVIENPLVQKEKSLTARIITLCAQKKLPKDLLTSLTKRLAAVAPEQLHDPEIFQLLSTTATKLAVPESLKSLSASHSVNNPNSIENLEHLIAKADAIEDVVSLRELAVASLDLALNANHSTALEKIISLALKYYDRSDFAFKVGDYRDTYWYGRAGRHEETYFEFKENNGILLIAAARLKDSGLSDDKSRTIFKQLTEASVKLRDFRALHVLAEAVVKPLATQPGKLDDFDFLLRQLAPLQEERAVHPKHKTYSAPEYKNNWHPKYYPTTLEVLITQLKNLEVKHLPESSRLGLIRAIIAAYDESAFQEYAAQIEYPSELNSYLNHIDKARHIDWSDTLLTLAKIQIARPSTLNLENGLLRIVEIMTQRKMIKTLQMLVPIFSNPASIDFSIEAFRKIIEAGVSLGDRSREGFTLHKNYYSPDVDRDRFSNHDGLLTLASKNIFENPSWETHSIELLRKIIYSCGKISDFATLHFIVNQIASSPHKRQMYESLLPYLADMGAYLKERRGFPPFKSSSEEDHYDRYNYIEGDKFKKTTLETLAIALTKASEIEGNQKILEHVLIKAVEAEDKPAVEVIRTRLKEEASKLPPRFDLLLKAVSEVKASAMRKSLIRNLEPEKTAPLRRGILAKTVSDFCDLLLLRMNLSQPPR